MFPAIGAGARGCPILPYRAGAALRRTRLAVSGQPVHRARWVAACCKPQSRVTTNNTRATPLSSSAAAAAAAPHRHLCPSFTTGSHATRAMSSANLVESAKKAAAFRAVDDHLDPSYRHVGIGSGSTVVYVVDAIAAKGPDFYRNMLFFPTGSQSKALIRKAGLALCNLPDRPLGTDGIPVSLDVAFDGADEVDAEFNCIKGGGACLLQEKGVAIRSKKFVVVADYRKISDRLCTKWTAGIPIEVDPFFATDVLADLEALGAIAPRIRLGLPAKAGECVTDNGNWLIDAPFKPLKLKSDPPAVADHEWEVSELAAALKGLTGVVETGLFWGMNGVEAEKSKLRRAASQKPVAAYFGMENGEVEVKNAL